MTRTTRESPGVVQNPSAVPPTLKHRGLLGLSIIVISEILLLCGVQAISEWFTPIVWTGYILLMDHVNHKLAGWSLLVDRRGEFFLMTLTSVACWAIFEVYNLHLGNWVYLNLPDNPWVRYLGYGVSFATIFPGIFQTYYFLNHIGVCSGFASRAPLRLQGSLRYLQLTGLVFLVIPLLVPASEASYLFGAVWAGFIFLLEPLNRRLGIHSLVEEIEEGNYAPMLNLLLAGAICGFLWEFWNYWSATRWIYTIPFPIGFKIFEMPALGFLGFPPFAIECHAMYNFCTLRKRQSR